MGSVVLPVLVSALDVPGSPVVPVVPVPVTASVVVGLAVAAACKRADAACKRGN